MKYTNHFGNRSSDYLQFRPNYPDSLFVYLAGLAKSHDTAWDCGTGNGQAAIELSQYFTQVIATDINQAQLDIAPKIDNISYYHCPAEKTHIPNASIDLITVAQALHWFDFTHFFNEVRRVAKPEGIIAAWSYSLGTITPEIDNIIQKLYFEILGDEYWPKERRYVDKGYKTIPFPFSKIVPPEFQIVKEMDFAQLLGYLATWSAVKEYQKRNQINPLGLIISDLEKAWGDPESTHFMTWPIHLLVGAVN